MDFLLFIGGLFIGIALTGLYFLIRSTSGTLRIDHTNPEKDVYRFEIDDLDSINKKKRIELKIDHNANLSQK